MLGMSIFVLTLLGIALCFFLLPMDGDKAKKMKMSKLEQANRQLRLQNAELLKTNYTLRTALQLNLPFPDIELQAAKDAIREEYPDIKFKDEK